MNFLVLVPLCPKGLSEAVGELICASRASPYHIFFGAGDPSDFWGPLVANRPQLFHHSWKAAREFQPRAEQANTKETPMFDLPLLLPLLHLFSSSLCSPVVVEPFEDISLFFLSR